MFFGEVNPKRHFNSLFVFGVGFDPSTQKQRQADSYLWIQNKTGLHKDFQASLEVQTLSQKKQNKTIKQKSQKSYCSHFSL